MAVNIRNPFGIILCVYHYYYIMRGKLVFEVTFLKTATTNPSDESNPQTDSSALSP